jgi:FkbM family methyltransferase
MFMPLPLWIATTVRRRVFETFGSRRFSMPGYDGVEQKLLRHLPTSGFFVEAGAVDGFFESTTYFLERFYGWSGILVEPTPRMFRRIRFNRPKAQAFNCALVSQAVSCQKVMVRDAHALSRVIIDGDTVEGCAVQVAARTLSSLLDEVNAPPIDLLSLDVEGYELEVLRGLDFGRHSPKYLLVECLSQSAYEAMNEFLGDRYRMLERVDYRDYLYARVS